VTIADSVNSPIINAPITAIVTNTSILTTLTFNAEKACRAIGITPITDAIIIGHLKRVSFFSTNSLKYAKAIRIPLINVILFFLLNMNLSTLLLQSCYLIYSLFISLYASSSSASITYTAS